MASGASTAVTGSHTFEALETPRGERIAEFMQHASPETLAVHASIESGPNNPWGALAPAVVPSSTFSFEDTAALCEYQAAHARGIETPGKFEYGRYANPTWAACEEALAKLERAEAAVLYPSGMGAVTSALLELCQNGSEVILGSNGYRRTRQFCEQVLSKYGIKTIIVPSGDITALRRAMSRDTAAVLLECPSNPELIIDDIAEVAAICSDSHQARSLIDSTFASPLNMSPHNFGIDLVIHSATKYLGGHNNILGGVVTGNEPTISLLKKLRSIYGNTPAPEMAQSLLLGLQTLGIRVAQQNKNGMALARLLESHHGIERVWYPGLESHPTHHNAEKYMGENGFGGVVTFTVRALPGVSERETTRRFVDLLCIPKIAASLGGITSLVEMPRDMSFFEMTDEQAAARGIPNNQVRYSAGIESTKDLLDDMEQALNALWAGQ